MILYEKKMIKNEDGTESMEFTIGWPIVFLCILGLATFGNWLMA